MMNRDEHDPALRVVNDIYEALDDERPDEALRLAREARNSGDEDSVIRFLAGLALLELDQPDQAAVELERAVHLDPDDAEFRSTLARALFRAGHFADAADQVSRALESDARIPDAHHVAGLLAERRGDDNQAWEHYRLAADADPERFPLPVRVDAEAFQLELRRASERLPEPFRRHLDGVAITVDPVPSDEIVLDGRPALDAENLLGLFVGVPIGQPQQSGELPPRILLFQRNLERMAGDRDELADEIAVTLYHELGHYLGLDEDELEQIDLA